MRDVFVIEGFWNILRKRCLGAMSHRNFEFGFNFFGVGLRFLTLSSSLFNNCLMFSAFTVGII